MQPELIYKFEKVMKYIKQIVSREMGISYSVDFTVLELPEDTSVII